MPMACSSRHSAYRCTCEGCCLVRSSLEESVWGERHTGGLLACWLVGRRKRGGGKHAGGLLACRLGSPASSRKDEVACISTGRLPWLDSLLAQQLSMRCVLCSYFNLATHSLCLSSLLLIPLPVLLLLLPLPLLLFSLLPGCLLSLLALLLSSLSLCVEPGHRTDM